MKSAMTAAIGAMVRGDLRAAGEQTDTHTGCAIRAHPRCVNQISLVCPVAFRPELVQASFVRCFASLFYTYRKFLHNASGERRKAGLLYHFNMEAFIKSVPGENAEYMRVLQQTQMFNEFVYERESTRSDDSSIKLFDEIILSKRNRGKAAIFSKSGMWSTNACYMAGKKKLTMTDTSFLSDKSDHLWRSALATAQNSRLPGDYRQIVTRSK